MKNPSLCVLPFLQFNILPSGVATQCCISSHPLRGAKGEELSILTHTFDEIWRSPSLAEMRRKMLAGEPVEQCAGCFTAECRKNSSYRDSVNAALLKKNAAGEYPVTFGERFPEFMAKQGAAVSPKFKASIEELPALAAGKPKSFDLRVDNKCNLKCVICTGDFSSQIEEDPVHSRWATADQALGIKIVPANRFGNDRKWARNAALLEEIAAFASEAEYVQMAGGEPFASRGGVGWLKHMVASGQSKRVDLTVFTNAQHISDEIIEHLSRFRTLNLILSIDAYGAQYEYVRYPGKWYRIEENVRRLEKINDVLGADFGMSINYTLSAFTMLSVRALLAWAAEKKIKVILSYATGPRYVSSVNLPPAIKAQAIRELEQASAEFGAESPHLPWLIDRLIEQLRISPFNREAAKEFLQFAADMDATRGLDFHRTFPEMSAAFRAWRASPRWLLEEAMALPSRLAWHARRRLRRSPAARRIYTWLKHELFLLRSSVNAVKKL